MTVVLVITLLPGPSWHHSLERSYWRRAAPEPYQAGDGWPDYTRSDRREMFWRDFWHDLGDYRPRRAA
jgi:hypothetical protein